MTKKQEIQLFEDKKVRSVWDSEQEKWYFSIVDIVAVLTESVDPKQYIKKLKARDPELKNNWGTICTLVPMISADGKKRKEMTADQQGMFRIIQSIPSPKAEPFKLWMAQVASQRLDQMQDPEMSQDQALLKILENPKHNQYGTYYKNGNMYIFAGLKKDDTVQEHLNYKDKFLDNQTFQWESIANIKDKDVQLQQNAKCAYVFVRKVKVENGITLPYTFVGTGHLTNPRRDETTNGSILYDIHMDERIPQDLMEDFQWTA